MVSDEKIRKRLTHSPDVNHWAFPISTRRSPRASQRGGLQTGKLSILSYRIILLGHTSLYEFNVRWITTMNKSRNIIAYFLLRKKKINLKNLKFTLKLLNLLQVLHLQKQSSGGVLRNFAKFTRKHRPATLLKKWLWHRCFPVNF